MVTKRSRLHIWLSLVACTISQWVGILCLSLTLDSWSLTSATSPYGRHREVTQRPLNATDLEARGSFRGHRVSIFQPYQRGAGDAGGITGQAEGCAKQYWAWQAGWQGDSGWHCKERWQGNRKQS